MASKKHEEEGSSNPQEAARVIEELRQNWKSQALPSPQDPFARLQQATSQLQNDLRQQQLAVEQQLQSTLSQASTALSDAEQLESLRQACQQLSGLLKQGGQFVKDNAPRLLKIVDEVETLLAQQQSKTDLQAARSLQQALSSLAQAQAASFKGRSLADLRELVKQCDQTLQDLRGGTVH